jgi:hypothetical protein
MCRKPCKIEQNESHWKPGMNWDALEGQSVSAQLVAPVMLNLVTNPMISREWGKDQEVLTTSGTYPWSFVTLIFHSDRKIFKLMTSTLKSSHMTKLCATLKMACQCFSVNRELVNVSQSTGMFAMDAYRKVAVISRVSPCTRWLAVK